MARDITIRYVGDSKSAERASAAVVRANEKVAASAKKTDDTVAKRFRGVGRSLSGAGRSITTFATLPIAGGFAVALKSASDLNEQVSKAKQVFGESSGAIDTFAKNASKNIGLSQSAAYEATGTFGNMFNQLGFGTRESSAFSQSLAVAAADLGSFHNADISQVIEAQTAAFRGEYDSLQRFIPTINAAAVQTEAMRQTGKKNADELTAQEKAAATYTLMMGGMGKAQGDFARTSDSAANRQRTLTARFQDLAASIGQQVLPIAVQFGDILADLLDRFNKLSPDVRKFILIGAGLIAVLGPIVGAVGALATVIGLILSPVGLVIAAIAALAFGLVYAYKHSETFRNILQTVMDWITGTAIPAVQNFATAFVETFSGIGEAIGHIMAVVQDIIRVTLEAIRVGWDLFGQTILGYVKAVWSTIWGIISGFITVISGLIKTVLAVINGDWSRAWEGIKQIFHGIWITIQGLLTGFLDFMKAALSNAWGLIKSAASAAWGAVRGYIKDQWAKIKSEVSAAATWVKDKLSGVWDSIKKKVSDVWKGIRDGISKAWEFIKDGVRREINGVIRIINGLIGGINKVLSILPGLGDKTIPKIPTLGGGGGGRGRGRASGGTVPPFVTDGPRAIVGEGNRAFPEFVIPTDPKYRSRALALLGQAGSKLMASGGKVPGYQLGGILGDIPGAGIVKGGVRALGEIGQGIAEFARKGAAIAIFGPINKVAEAAINAIPWKIGRQFAQGVRQWLYDWVKGQDDKLPTDGGGGSRGRGPGIAGLYEPLASVVAKVIAAADGAVHVVSGWRSSAQQQVLYNRYLAGTGNLAAKPGTSKHERGLAVDYGGSQSTWQRLHRSFGGHFPVRGEPWHGEIPGYQYGGRIKRDGLFWGHAGERVTPAGSRNNGGSTVINIDLRGSAGVDDEKLARLVVQGIKTAGDKGIPITVRGRRVA